MLNNFDAAKRLMTTHNDGSTIRDKLDLFFIDYDLIPLMIQENYLGSNPPNNASLIDLNRVAFAADLISTGDVLNQAIRGRGEWSLMPNLGFNSAIYPCEIVKPFVHFPKFPEWLGKNSSQRKKYRELRELKSVLSVSTTGTRQAILLDYVKPIIDMLNYNLRDGDKLSVENTVDILDHYNLTPEIIKEHLTDLNPRKVDALVDVSSSAKSMLTRSFNQHHKTSIKNKKPKRQIGAGESSEMGKRFNLEAEEDEGGEEEDDENNDENTQEESQIEVEDKAAPKGKGKGQGAKSGKGRSKKA